jgi:DNA topoisomerase-2
MALKQDYDKLTHEQHVLKLPDTYIGDIENNVIDIWCMNHEEQRMKNKALTYIPGEYKLFDELLVNALDQYIRVKESEQEGLMPVKNIKINVDKSTGLISVFNDGEGISIEMHEKEQKYIPELIFGELLTSSNYTDGDIKHVGGKNGYGAKLANIFSIQFTIETVDRHKQKKFSMSFYDNKTRKDKPKITNYTSKPYTKISYIPDFARFKSTGITDDMMALMEKRAYDLSACTESDVAIYFNDTKIDCKNFERYTELYLGPKKEHPRVYERVNHRWEICVALSPSLSFEQISFVNGIHTSKGGKHVDYIINQITKKLCDWIKKKKKVVVKQNYIKENLIIFIKSTIDNPSFDSQTKEFMTTNKDKFGMKCDISDKFIDQLSKCGIIEKAIVLAEAKDNKNLKKTDGKKQSHIKGIPKLEDANWAGTKNGKYCTLILTEGDSAKSTAMAGLDIIGRDKYGVFPLKGKVINVRDPSNNKKIPDNAEIVNVKKIMGLKTDHKYMDVETLRYGKIMILTDQDEDGSHIKGLVFNLFETMWPELFKIEGFLNSMLTPIIKMKKGKELVQFYSVKDYDKWLEADTSGKSYDIKYYKGLATSTPKEAKEYFKDLKIVEYTSKENLDIKALDMAFSKKDESANTRKEWLSKYDRNATLDYNSPYVTIDEFINYDLIHFSNSDNIRSIPNIMDGLKPSQRKVLFASLKRNLTDKEIRVAQLAGYTSENAAYHHGEMSLNGTIINMAQHFIGSNNIPLLEDVGQFGTRIGGGKDAGQPRYIYTKLSTITPTLYNSQDFALMDAQYDDGLKVEPVFYTPIIPMILVNGSSGIGTGWSTEVPCFNPLDIIDNINNYLNGVPMKEIVPWYNGFTGTIVKLTETSFLTKGKYEISGNKLIVTELPIGKWTDKYKEDLENMIIDIKNKSTKQIIRSYLTYSTDVKVHFEIMCDASVLAKLDVYDEKLNMTKLEKTFKLCSTISTNNMVLYDDKSSIKRYKNVLSIIENYCNVRKHYYQLRIDYIIKGLTEQIDILSHKARFIGEFINNTINIIKTKKEVIIEQLKTKKYPEVLGNWDYLLKMPIYNLSQDKIDELNDQLANKEQELADINAQTPSSLWKNELNKLSHVLPTTLSKLLGETPIKKKLKIVKKKKVQVN